ncbi:unnamed protein product [Adineta steineri]|uniref:Uncharacterized protein n=1 Tax=Adineta steineri TaxID=433720 RepID=A0A813NRS8_9BILA|nr:unnamed protein product [Adineta steineri]CAF0753445.1 unnamed protein product [Adineta steineri]
MDDRILKNVAQANQIFKENFRSQTAQNNDKAYLLHLNQELRRWTVNTDELMREIIEEKTDEIKRIYEQFTAEYNQKYETFKQQLQNTRSLSDSNDQIEEFNIYCRSNTIQNRLRLIIQQVAKNELAEKIQLEYLPYRGVIRDKPIKPSETPIYIKHEPIIRSRSSSITSSIPVSTKVIHKQYTSDQNIHKNGSMLKPIQDPLNREPSYSKIKSTKITTTTLADDNLRQGSTQFFVGSHHNLTPILVDRNRDLYNKDEQITEYSIDSIAMPYNEQNQSDRMNLNTDNDITVVTAYKVLIEKENDRQQQQRSISNYEGEDSNFLNVFNLRKLNQINYSTIMFRECETEYNCIASSTKRNELVVYNSKLKVIIILQHENYQQCRHRFYLHWPKEFSPRISDITYSESSDKFLITTWDSCHIYLFDRDLLSIINFGCLPKGAKTAEEATLRRIHCDQRTVYCIHGNNYLLEYELDEDNSNLNFIKRIRLFNPSTFSQDTAYHLLDVTCDANYLVIVYSDNHDEIHLQSLKRRTYEFHNDLVVDSNYPINQNYIRVESTKYNKNFIYLNGSRDYLKEIDLVNYENGKVSSVVRRHTKPTNLCFLNDGRLVILHEEPYFLSVHDLHNRPAINE